VLEACTVVEQVDMELEQVGAVLEQAAWVAELVGAMVPPVVEVLAAVAMAADVESPLAKTAPLVGSAAAAEDPVRVLYHTLELARESTYRRRRTSMLGLEVILTMFDQEEISPASSQAAVC